MEHNVDTWLDTLTPTPSLTPGLFSYMINVSSTLAMTVTMQYQNIPNTSDRQHRHHFSTKLYFYQLMLLNVMVVPKKLWINIEYPLTILL